MSSTPRPRPAVRIIVAGLSIVLALAAFRLPAAAALRLRSAEAWMAAPWATTSSGSIPAMGSFWK